MGRLNIHWSKVEEGGKGDNFTDFCGKISKLPRGQFWRHNAAGDLSGKGELIDFSNLEKLVKANKDKRGFTYTHKPVLAEDIVSDFSPFEKETIARMNRAAVKFANDNGFTVNLSGNSLPHADKLKKLGIGPVVSVVPLNYETGFSPDGNKAVVCPAVSKQHTTCATCQLCQKGERGAIVAFPAHGVAKKFVSEIAAAG